MTVITTRDASGVTQVAVEERPQEHEGRLELRSPGAAAGPGGKPS